MNLPESARRVELRTSIASRLKGVCADWPPDVFDQMVSNLADITLRYEGANPASDTAAVSDLLVEQMRELTRKSGEVGEQH